MISPYAINGVHGKNDRILHNTQIGFRHGFSHKAVFTCFNTVHLLETYFVVLQNHPMRK